ncbi:hypothetical protein J2Z26_004487, partial [Bacillus luteolus]|nr:hypothetical protein [Cytobacillus luteolus]
GVSDRGGRARGAVAFSENSTGSEQHEKIPL